MNKAITLRVWHLLIAGALVIMLAVSACGKFTEPFRDAPVQGQDQNSSLEVTQPDGFSNAAVKCFSKGMAIATAYHGDSAYGAVSISPDPNCKHDGSRP